jgi:uncharacterized protein with LGFP repeats
VSTRVAQRAATFLAARTSRRGFLARSAVVGSALVTTPVSFLLRPGTAYASVCGPDSTCGAGYTVFCCTINRGVNSCPPGTLAAGWWKADAASICGGKARYIVDCNATCSGCRSGCGHFCSSSCWSCSCRCGPTSSCDQRRVCCNVFRYGQCHQEVPCVGPVACRVVTCVPPYQLGLSCSTSSATDNATRDQSAPCNLNVWGAIAAHYYALGGSRSPLGATIGDEYDVAGGRGAAFEHGRMYWSPSSGAHYVQGAILSKWASLRAYSGFLRFPTTDELSAAPDGRWNRFQGGVIVWGPRTGAWSVRGGIAAKYLAMRGTLSPLGFPVSDEMPAAPDGAWSRFEHGILVWGPRTGARSVLGGIAVKYLAMRGTLSPLGFPVSDEMRAAPDGAWSRFEHGIVVWGPRTGAWPVLEPIAAAYLALRGTVGPLGFPVADPKPAARGGSRAPFQGGTFFASGPTGAHWAGGAILRRYRRLDGPAGRLGYPVSDPYDVPRGTENEFERGWITFVAATGQTEVRYKP